jgi:hypothetical protein
LFLLHQGPDEAYPFPTYCWSLFLLLEPKHSKHTIKLAKNSTTVAARVSQMAVENEAEAVVLELISWRMMPNMTKSMIMATRETMKATNAMSEAKRKPTWSEQSAMRKDRKAMPRRCQRCPGNGSDAKREDQTHPQQQGAGPVP